ncbi:MAG: ISL3 family transposase [Pseudonocardiaceae bacterium]
MRYARRTVLLRGMLESIGLALAGRAGTRLATTLGLPASRSTLLRVIRALPDPEIATVTVLGVDDFAPRRGHVYGTVLVDIDTGRPIDLLADREAATVAAWLREHPGTRVVCRDRAGAYAEGARGGAPEAIQVADRWHLWHNLAEYVEKTIAAHHGCLRQPDDIPLEAAAERGGAADLAEAAQAAQLLRTENSALVVRTQARYQAIQALKADGRGLKTIMRELDLAKETVRRFYRAGNVEELLAKPRAGRPSVLDAYKPYLLQRWNAGITNASTLHREITDQGYRGSRGTVAAYLAPFRALGAAPPPTPVVPKVRQITSWIPRRPEDLDADEQRQLKQVLASCPHLEATATHVATFAEMITGRHGERLDSWMAAVDAADRPHLHRFVTGLRRDYQTVRNGLTLSHSSGTVEGNVNRIKMIKRQARPSRRLTIGANSITESGPDPDHLTTLTRRWWRHPTTRPELPTLGLGSAMGARGRGGLPGERSTARRPSRGNSWPRPGRRRVAAQARSSPAAGSPLLKSTSTGVVSS